MSESVAADPHLDAFRTALACQSSPCVYGSCPVAPESLVLFYGKDEPAKLGRLDFLKTSEAEIKDLADTCDAATFGRNQEDILDETYRKAGKLDNTQFAINLEPYSIGLINHIKDMLLEGHDDGTAIRCELYKLNVYGPGSFFKSHKDTPRGDDMFASLVVILPTPHEGGGLVFRKQDKEFKFDSAAAVNTSPETPHIAFAAFFSDVDHEVDVVRSGYRVTITWNLYFVKMDPGQDSRITTAFESSLKDALRNLLANPTYLPNGGFLGFGLRHEYPVDTSYDYYIDGPELFRPIDHLLGFLKGSDAVLYKVCQDVGVKTTLQMVYDDDDAKVLCPGNAWLGDTEWDEAIWSVLQGAGGKLIEPPYESDWDLRQYGRRHHPDITVQWITEMRPVHIKKISTQYVTYGNQAQMGTVYSTLVLVVELGPHDNRAAPMEHVTVDEEPSRTSDSESESEPESEPEPEPAPEPEPELAPEPESEPAPEHGSE